MISPQAQLEQFVQVRHRCPACRRSWASKTRARRHAEHGCTKNPESKSCHTCKHYSPAYTGGRDEGPGRDHQCNAELESGGQDIDGLHGDDMPRQCPAWVATA